MGKGSNEVDPGTRAMSAEEQVSGRVPGDRGVFEEDRVGVHPAAGAAGMGVYDDETSGVR